MKVSLAAGFVSLAALSCGGGASKGASAPASGGSSQISMNFPADSANGTPAGSIDLSGPALAQFDPDQKALMIYVLDPATQPTPSCDHVGVSALLQQKAGATAVVMIKDFGGVPGKVHAGMAMIVKGDASQLQAPPQSMLDATTVDIATFDKTSIEAKISSEPSAKVTVSGTIHGTMCPNISIVAQAQAAQDAAIAQANANGGMSAIPGDPSASDAPSYQVQLGASISLVDASKALVKLDPKSKVLLVATWTPNLPPPTCDLLAAPAKTPATEGGTITLLYAKTVAAKGPGKYPVYAVKQLEVGPSPGPETIAGVEGTIDIHQFDDKTFAAGLDVPSKVTLSGSVAGTVCPAGHVDVPVVGAAKPTKKKKKK